MHATYVTSRRQQPHPVLLLLLCLGGCFQGESTSVGPVVSDRQPASNETDTDPTSEKGIEATQPQQGLVLPGETLSKVLAVAGLSPAALQQATQLLQEVLDVHRIPANSNYQLYRDPAGNLNRVVLHLNPYEDVTLLVRPKLAAWVDTKEAKTVLRKAQGSVSSTLHETLVTRGHPIGLAAALQMAFGNRVNFRRLSRGARFQVLYSERQVEGESIGEEQVLGARIEYHGTVQQAFLYENGEKRYFDESGAPLSGVGLFSPVENPLISSPYSQNRLHPVLGRRMPHLGTDYAAPYGSPVRAVADGVVIAAARGRYNGNFVKIKHDEAFRTQYLHLSSFAPGLAEGQLVRQGETIAFVGNTGLTDGVHLCFRLWKNGQQVDPRVYGSGLGSGPPAGPQFHTVAAEISRKLGPFLPPEATPPSQVGSPPKV